MANKELPPGYEIKMVALARHTGCVQNLLGGTALLRPGLINSQISVHDVAIVILNRDMSRVK